MARSDDPAPPGPPTPERRCTATINGKRKGVGTQCTRWAIRGTNLCPSHKPGAGSPSHNPPEERRCQGKSLDADGHRTQPCKLWAIRGLAVCYRHGGARKETRAAGDRRMAEDKIEKKARALATLFEITPVNNPLEALAQHVGEEIRFKDILATLVKDLRADEIRYTDAKGSEQLRSEIAVYERALGRVGDRLVAYAKLGIDERLVKIEEGKAAMVMGAINAVIAHLGATGAAAAEARQIGARHLRAVAEAG